MLTLEFNHGNLRDENRQQRTGKIRDEGVASPITYQRTVLDAAVTFKGTDSLEYFTLSFKNH